MPAWFEDDLFDLIDLRKSRAGCKVVLERLDAFFAALCQSLYRAVVQILYITKYLMPRGRALCKISKPYTLYGPADEEFASDHNQKFPVPSSKYN